MLGLRTQESDKFIQFLQYIKSRQQAILFQSLVLLNIKLDDFDLLK